MQDTIILGNGTSKQIKTASLPNSYAEFKAMAENGNLFADIKLNADGCEVVGTPLNKLNLLTDETAGKIGNPENIDKAIENLYSTINGIPVDLTGIYNTQVIGYDETQGKLVPMINVARTETVFPNSITPVPWIVEQIDVPSWLILDETEIYYPYFKGTHLGYVNGQSYPFKILVTLTNSYLLGEFTKFNFNPGDKNFNSPRTIKIEFSKSSTFDVIEATYEHSISGTFSGNITSLIGRYYIRIYVSLTTYESITYPSDCKFSISAFNFAVK